MPNKARYFDACAIDHTLKLKEHERENLQLKLEGVNDTIRLLNSEIAQFQSAGISKKPVIQRHVNFSLAIDTRGHSTSAKPHKRLLLPTKRTLHSKAGSHE